MERTPSVSYRYSETKQGFVLKVEKGTLRGKSKIMLKEKIQEHMEYVFCIGRLEASTLKLLATSDCKVLAPTVDSFRREDWSLLVIHLMVPMSQ